MSVDSTVDARMHAFMKDVQELMEKHDMGIAIVGLSTPMDEEGFTTFAAALRDGSRPVDEQFRQLDAIRTDMRNLYDDVGRVLGRQLMGEEGMSDRVASLMQGLDLLRDLSTGAKVSEGDVGNVGAVNTVGDVANLASGEIPQSVADLIEKLRGEGKNVAVVRVGPEGLGKKKGKTFLN